MAGSGVTWRVGELLGLGGFAAVYGVERADHPELAAPLAAKLLRADLSRDPNMVRRLVREARTLRQLDHPVMVRLHELAWLDEQLALLTERVDGVDLRRVLARNGPLPPAHALHIVEQVARALHRAVHSVPAGRERPLGLVHGDLKPANLMITDAGAVKLLDLGIARATLPESETLNGRFGTPGYLAPERLLGAEPEARSDIFALGITLIQLVSGRLPDEAPRYEDDDDDWSAEVLALLDGTHVPPGLVALASDMVSWRINARPTADQVASRAHEQIRQIGDVPFATWAAAAVGPEISARRAAPVDGPLTGRLVQVLPVALGEDTMPRPRRSSVTPVVAPEPPPPPVEAVEAVEAVADDIPELPPEVIPEPLDAPPAPRRGRVVPTSAPEELPDDLPVNITAEFDARPLLAEDDARSAEVLKPDLPDVPAQNPWRDTRPSDPWARDPSVTPVTGPSRDVPPGWPRNPSLRPLTPDPTVARREEGWPPLPRHDAESDDRAWPSEATPRQTPDDHAVSRSTYDPRSISRSPYAPAPRPAPPPDPETAGKIVGVLPIEATAPPRASIVGVAPYTAPVEPTEPPPAAPPPPASRAVAWSRYLPLAVMAIMALAIPIGLAVTARITSRPAASGGAAAVIPPPPVAVASAEPRPPVKPGDLGTALRPPDRPTNVLLGPPSHRLDPRCPMDVNLPPGTYTFTATTLDGTPLRSVFTVHAGDDATITCAPDGCTTATHHAGGDAAHLTFDGKFTKGYLQGRSFEKCVSPP